MVSWSFNGPLLLQCVLHSGDTGLPYFWLGGALSPALPIARHVPSPNLRALTNKLSKLALLANAAPKGKRLLCLLQTRVHALLNPPPVTQTEQRVDAPIDTHKAQQRVINDPPIIIIPRITEALGIMKLRNPTAKRTLKRTPQLHQGVTRNNTPDSTSIPTVVPTMPQLAAVQMYHPILLGARSRIVMQNAINTLTAINIVKCQDIFRPHILSNAAPSRMAI
jgi:hypothetical protein